MKTSRAWTVYILVRVLAFIVPFGIIMLVLPTWQWNWLVGVIVGAIVSLTISQIFLYREQIEIGGAIQERAEARKARANERRPIDIEEDADIDAQSPDATEEDADDSSASDSPEKP
ncbi:MAG: hypothetical protein ACTHXA_06320 [Gulosibacter sp.]|uniref:hypothetical protein n=1 Tax=Gulosibacter sp. TaxID=2817531 RepID=UPI003F8F8A11